MIFWPLQIQTHNSTLLVLRVAHLSATTHIYIPWRDTVHWKTGTSQGMWVVGSRTGKGTLSLAWKWRQHGSVRRKKTRHLWCSEMLHQAGAWYQKARCSRTWLRTRRSLTQQSSVLMNHNWTCCVEELNVTGNTHLDIWHHGDGFETCWTLSNHYRNPDRMYPQTPTKTSTNSAVLLDIQWKYQHSLLVLLLPEATMLGRERRQICYLPAASPRCS